MGSASCSFPRSCPRGFELANAKGKARRSTRKLERADNLADGTREIDLGWTRTGAVADLVHAAAWEQSRSRGLSREGVKQRVPVLNDTVETVRLVADIFAYCVGAE
jgi:biopolymer transport protein ExbB